MTPKKLLTEANHKGKWYSHQKIDNLRSLDTFFESGQQEYVVNIGQGGRKEDLGKTQIDDAPLLFYFCYHFDVEVRQYQK